MIRLLKIRGETSLTDLSIIAGVSKMAVLKRLSKLESEGLVERNVEHDGETGRPRHTYKLSPKASALFPRAYTDLALCALAFIEQKGGRQAVTEMLLRRQKELFERYGSTMQESSSLKERVDKLSQLRDSEGYMAESSNRRKGSFEIVEHNCPILALAEKYGEACSAERDLFSWLLQADVEMSHRVVAGDPVCRFIIRGRSTQERLSFQVNPLN